MGTSRQCRNEQCGELLDGEHMFCPSCRLAIWIGFKHGAVIVGVLAAVVGFLLGLLR